MTNNAELTWQEFMKIQMRVGTVISAEEFLEVTNPAYKLIIDFGPYGKKKTSAQLTKLYDPSELIGKQVIAVVNFPPKQIAYMMSECLVLGGIGAHKAVALIRPEINLDNGTRRG